MDIQKRGLRKSEVNIDIKRAGLRLSVQEFPTQIIMRRLLSASNRTKSRGIHF